MNIKNFKFHNTRVKLTNSEYWDYYLSNDDRDYYTHQTPGILSGDSLVLNFDFNNSDIFSTGGTSGLTITSLSTWDGAVNSGITLTDIGLTGIDNGLVIYDHYSGDTTNIELTDALLTSTLLIPDNKHFFMTRVTGSTTTTGLTPNFIYPITFEYDDLVGQYAKFCGGFYQGFYKLDEFDYQVLPNRVNKAWVMDFVIRKESCSGYTGTTLNDKYPNNEGFFFFMGTRAENKFWTVFTGNSSGCTSSACTQCVTTGGTEYPGQYCTIPRETNITSSTGYPLSPPPIEIKEITNNFLIYSRGGGSCCGEGGCSTGSTCENPWSIDFTGGTSGTTDLPYSLFNRNSDSSYCEYDYNDKKFGKCKVGRRACSHDDSTVYFSSITKTLVDDRNQFLVYSRGAGCLCGQSGHTGQVGERACSYSGDSAPLLELDYKADLIYNVFGFRITNDGEVGYRLIDKKCLTGDTKPSTGLTIVEHYSVSGVVQDDVWTNVAIRWVADLTYTDCELGFKPQRNGTLYIYVNGKLKLQINDFKEIILKSLYEDNTKQEGVPFNYSLGGGSQGLLESMTFDGQDPDDLGLEVEENFAGTFIGGISKFRMYIDDINWCGIKNNYRFSI